MPPKLTEKNRDAALRCLDAFIALKELDPLFAELMIHELSLAMRDPEGFISACAPEARDDARAMLFGPRSKR